MPAAKLYSTAFAKEFCAAVPVGIVGGGERIDADDAQCERRGNRGPRELRNERIARVDAERGGAFLQERYLNLRGTGRRKAPADEAQMRARLVDVAPIERQSGLIGSGAL